MTVMEYMNAHREDMEPCECVILPDGSVEEPQPSHIKKLEEISGEDKLTLNSRMEKNMEPIFFMVEYTGCMLVWSTRVVVPSHPTAAQEETLENLYFAAMLAPDYHREQVGPTYEECVKKAKELHEYLRNYGGLGEDEKPLVVSAILLALREKEYGFNLNQLTGDTLESNTDGAILYQYLEKNLQRAKVAPEVKNNVYLTNSH